MVIVMADAKPGESKLRQMKSELNYLTKSDGSAILSQGKLRPNSHRTVLVNSQLDITLTKHSVDSPRYYS